MLLTDCLSYHATCIFSFLFYFFTNNKFFLSLIWCMALNESTSLSFRLESAVLDLVADDTAGMQRQKSVYHWDKVSLTFTFSFCYYHTF